jgi:hypothetical protein
MCRMKFNSRVCQKLWKQWDDCETRWREKSLKEHRSDRIQAEYGKMLGKEISFENFSRKENSWKIRWKLCFLLYDRWQHRSSMPNEVLHESHKIPGLVPLSECHCQLYLSFCLVHYIETARVFQTSTTTKHDKLKQKERPLWMLYVAPIRNNDNHFCFSVF